jgi:hypothetical protein
LLPLIPRGLWGERGGRTGLAQFLAQQEFAEHEAGQCLGVAAQVRVVVEVPLRRDALAPPPPLSLIDPQHRRQLVRGKLAHVSQEPAQVRPRPLPLQRRQALGRRARLDRGFRFLRPGSHRGVRAADSGQGNGGEDSLPERRAGRQQPPRESPG